MKERPIITDLALQLDRLRQERDAVTQELNQERNRANDLERELSYRVADINRLRQQVERLQAELAEVKREFYEYKQNLLNSNSYIDTIQVCTCGTTAVCPLHQVSLAPTYVVNPMDGSRICDQDGNRK